ncbi:hypothetical protein DID74_00305 [Candidatus Marinamargulisbacteria bacterium SCGC AG-333-B06]|nr:hypothetical protein DID74_00305 [Candidatus Marinamargulisbacteria bacterium SCGC AG-333-B06]
MKIVKLDELLIQKYQEYVSNHKNGLFYYSVDFKKFLESLFDIESHYLIAIDNQEKIIGIFPLMIKNGRFGKVINSLPFYGSNGGILSSSKEASEALYSRYSKMINDPQFVAGTCIENPLNPESIDYKYNYLDERVGQWTLLKEQTSNSLMESFDSSTRRNIRKAEKKGITIEIDNTAISFLKDIHQQNMNDIGGLAKSDKFFSLIPNFFKPEQDFDIYVAKKGNKIIAALLLFYFNHTVEYYTPVIINEHRSDQPLAGIIFQAMSDAINKNYHWWNWGGTWKTQEGVYKFKKKWAAIDKPYKYYTTINNQTILDQSKKTLLSEYPNFFVVSFNELKEIDHAKN